jgi:hypothetical protein
MSAIEFHRVHSNDTKTFILIADWYMAEWKIPVEQTIQKLQTVTAENSQFQILMTLDGNPISTAGLYTNVGILEKVPRLKVYKYWLALVYTIPVKRHQGYGAMICKFIQEYSKSIGHDSMYLFTDTAERLYKRLGWAEIERITLGNRNVVVMKKDLLNDYLI